MNSVWSPYPSLMIIKSSLIQTFTPSLFSLTSTFFTGWICTTGGRWWRWGAGRSRGVLNSAICPSAYLNSYLILIILHFCLCDKPLVFLLCSILYDCSTSGPWLSLPVHCLPCCCHNKTAKMQSNKKKAQRSAAIFLCKWRRKAGNQNSNCDDTDQVDSSCGLFSVNVYGTFIWMPNYSQIVAITG